MEKEFLQQKFIEALWVASGVRVKTANHVLWALVSVIVFLVYVLFIAPEQKDSSSTIIPVLGLSVQKRELLLVSPLFLFWIFWLYIHAEYRSTRLQYVLQSIYKDSKVEDQFTNSAFGEAFPEYFTEVDDISDILGKQAEKTSRLLVYFQYPISMVVAILPIFIGVWLLEELNQEMSLTFIWTAETWNVLRIIVLLDVLTIPAGIFLVWARFIAPPTMDEQVRSLREIKEDISNTPSTANSGDDLFQWLGFPMVVFPIVGLYSTLQGEFSAIWEGLSLSTKSMLIFKYSCFILIGSTCIRMYYWKSLSIKPLIILTLVVGYISATIFSIAAIDYVHFNGPALIREVTLLYLGSLLLLTKSRKNRFQFLTRINGNFLLIPQVRRVFWIILGTVYISVLMPSWIMPENIAAILDSIWVVVGTIVTELIVALLLIFIFLNNSSGQTQIERDA